jgi:hypothetical protein
MTFTEEQVEWIVVEVLRRLGVAPAQHHSNANPNGSELSLTDNVVTLRSLEGRLRGVNRLVVQKQAVVTPAVKDELKTRNIELIFGEKEH